MKIIGKRYDQSGRRLIFTPGQGTREEKIYVGESEALNSLNASVIALNKGHESRLDRAGVASELAVTSPVKTSGEAELTLEIRMAVNRIQKDILEPDPDTNFGLTEDEIRTIRDAVRNPQPGSAPSLTGTANSIYLLMMQGVKYRIVYQPVLQIVRSAPVPFSWPAEHYANVGAIHSDAQMLSDQGITQLINFTLASRAFPESAPSGFGYGWLKHCPWYDTSVGNRTTENAEFEYGLWSTLLYPAAS